MTYTKTHNPCDDCPHSYSKNNQESNVCKICEFNRQQAEIENYKSDKEEYIKDYEDLENNLKHSEQERKFEHQRVVSLQTENERLKKLVDEEKEAYNCLADCFSKECDEVRTLTLRLKNANEYEVFLTAKQKTAKSEAVKEFAERLKENTVTVKIGKQTCRVITVEGIDNLLKEMG